MDQNINFSGSDQIQTPQYPEVNPPSQETSKEVSQAKKDLITSIQNFLEKFKCMPFEEQPKSYFQTWWNFFNFKYAKPEDSNELFQKLLEDLKELAQYEKSTNKDRPIFLNDNKDHPIQNKESPENSSKETVVSNPNQEPPQDSDIYQLIEECSIQVCKEQKQNMEKTMLDLVKICHHKQFLCMYDNVEDLIEGALDTKLLSIKSQHPDNKQEQEVKNVEEQPAEYTPILSTKEPENLLSMGYKHLSITPETEINEVMESNAKNLLPIPSECEVTSEDKRECDDLICENPSTIDVCDNHSEILFDSNNDDLSSDDESFEDIEY
nr:hypothetical protein [Tanacetum cinerariifolium]